MLGAACHSPGEDILGPCVGFVLQEIHLDFSPDNTVKIVVKELLHPIGNVGWQHPEGVHEEPDLASMESLDGFSLPLLTLLIVQLGHVGLLSGHKDLRECLNILNVGLCRRPLVWGHMVGLLGTCVAKAEVKKHSPELGVGRGVVESFHHEGEVDASQMSIPSRWGDVCVNDWQILHLEPLVLNLRLRLCLSHDYNFFCREDHSVQAEAAGYWCVCVWAAARRDSCVL